MVSDANYQLNFHIYGLKFVPIVITLLLQVFAVLTSNNNDNNDSLRNILVLAISQKHLQNNNKNIKIVSTDKTAVLSHDATTTSETNTKHNPNAMTTSNGRSDVGNSNSKIVILTFGDTIKSQITSAKPILDQFGFKASFFITCGFPGDDNKNGSKININKGNEFPRMSWNDILTLQQDDQDIESKGMTHRDLDLLAPNDLDFEVDGSKQCLENQGIKSPNIFAVVHGDAWGNPAVIDTISKYYGFADNGFANLMFLHCDGYKISRQTDCRTYNDNGTLAYANRYSIREESHNSWDQNYLHNDMIIFQRFIQEVNSQVPYNSRGSVNAIPIMAYHSIDDSKGPFSTDVNLFASEMKYLHDNGFRVIPMSNLAYDESTNYMYIRNN